jgi:hypothetical protein
MAKERAPAFQFYAADYIADLTVQLMSLEEEGCLIRLLAYCWREGNIPSDPELLKRLCKGTIPSKAVTGCFNHPSKNPSYLLHPQLEAERLKQAIWRHKSAIGGKASAGKRKHKKNISPEQGGSTLAPGVVQPKGNIAVCSLQSSISEQASQTSPACPEPEKPLAPDSSNASKSVFSELPCKGKRPLYQISVSYIAEMKALYPGVDIEKETLRAKGWLINNPTRGKTYSGMTRFLNSWYSKAQNQAGGKVMEGIYDGKSSSDSRPASLSNQPRYIPKPNELL